MNDKVEEVDEVLSINSDIPIIVPTEPTIVN